MKNIILIRHAKSSWKNLELADHDRPLNKRGKRDAPLMGEHLKQKAIKPDLILSSPAKRAMKTAGIISKNIGFPINQIEEREEIYGASHSTLTAIIQQIEDRFETVILFGHNPALTQLTLFLTHHSIDNIPTCGVVSVTFEILNWEEVSEGKGNVDFFEYPKKIHNIT